MTRKRKSEEYAAGQDPGKKIWRIGVYIRLSKEDGNEESLSVTNQKKIIREYLETCFGEEYVLVGFYIDDGLTGTDYDRPDFQRMIYDMEEGKVNCIVCKNLSRMFRNYSDQGYFLEKVFPMNRVRFITVSEPRIDSYLHPETIEGLEIPISGLMNDRFAAKTSHDIRDTFGTKRRKGEFIGAFAPYGYKKSPENKNALVIDEEAAEVVRNIFHWFVYEGVSKNGIARRLNRLGIPNPSAYKKGKGLKFCCPQMEKSDGLWSPVSVGTVLKNRMYTGTMVQGKQTVISYKVHDKVAVPEKDWYVVPYTHTPIIEEALFCKAGELRARNMRMAPAEKKVHLLAGFIRCADCKKAMTRQRSGHMIYYYCRTFREKSKDACTKHTVKEETVAAAVLAAIRMQIALIDSVEKVIEEIISLPPKPKGSLDLPNLLRLRQKELERITDLTDGLYEDWKGGIISKEEYIRLKGKYLAQADQLKVIIKNLWQEQEALEKREPQDQYLTEFISGKNIKSLNRGILVHLISNIYIHQKGQITIEFNFADPYGQVSGQTGKRREDRMGFVMP